MKKIIAIIVSYGSPDHTAACLTAIGQSERAFAAVHVCENAGPEAYRLLLDEIRVAGASGAEPQQDPPVARATQTTRLDLKGLPVLVHCANANLGYAGGVNLCLAAIAGAEWDAVLILNPDSVIAPGALSALIEHARDPSYGVIGCRLVLADTGTIQMYGGRWRPWIGRTRNLGFGASKDAVPDSAAIEKQTNFVCGAAMYATRRFVDAVGPMDEDYFLYMEEVDWCFRAGDFRLGYAHDAIVTHTHGVSTGASTRPGHRSALSIYLNERNKLRFTLRFYPMRYPVVLLTTFAYNLLYLKRGGVRQFYSAMSGWVAGLRGETGPPAGYG